jgi:hypothetical protein
MEHNIDVQEEKEYKSDIGMDYFTRATIDGRYVSSYFISTDMSSTHIVNIGGVTYSRTIVQGDNNIPPYMGKWMSSDGSDIPEWLDGVIAYL